MIVPGDKLELKMYRLIDALLILVIAIGDELELELKIMLDTL